MVPQASTSTSWISQNSSSPFIKNSEKPIIYSTDKYENPKPGTTQTHHTIAKIRLSGGDHWRGSNILWLQFRLINREHLFHKWRRRRDSNPRNPFEVRFFSKEVLSATQSRLQKVNMNTKRACFKDQSKIAERVHFSLYDRISGVYWWWYLLPFKMEMPR